MPVSTEGTLSIRTQAYVEAFAKKHGIDLDEAAAFVDECCTNEVEAYCESFAGASSKLALYVQAFTNIRETVSEQSGDDMSDSKIVLQGQPLDVLVDLSAEVLKHCEIDPASIEFVNMDDVVKH